MSSVRNLSKGVGKLLNEVFGVVKEEAGIGKEVTAALADRPAVQVTPEQRASAIKTYEAMGAREKAAGAPFGEPVPFKETMALQDALYGKIQDDLNDQTKKLRRVLTEIYQDTKSPANKERLKTEAQQWGVDLTPTSGVGGIEGIGDDIEALFATEGIGGIMKRFKPNIEAKLETASINEARSQVEPFVGSEAVEKVLADPKISNFDKAYELQKMLVAIQDGVNTKMKQNPDGLFRMADKAIRDLPMAANELYTVASENGLAATADATREFIMFKKKGSRATEKVYNLVMSVRDALKTMDSVDLKKADAIRKYIEISGDFRGRIRMGGAGDAIPVDANALAFIKKKFGIDLGADDIEFANRARSTFRLAERNLDRQDIRREYVDDLPIYRLDEIDPADTALWFERFGDKDFGHNYWHLVATEEYLAKAMERDPDLRSLLPSLKEDYLKNRSYFMNQKTRLVTLEDGTQVPLAYVFPDEGRLRPWQEVEQMAQQYRGYLRGKIGRDRINGIVATIALPTGKLTERQPLYKMVDDLRQFHEETLSSSAPVSAGGQMLSTVTQSLVSLALFKPAMDLNNGLQGVVNGATYHGFSRTLLATAVAGVKMPFYLLRNKGNMRAAWEDMAAGFSDPEKRKIVQRIVSESSETRRFLDEDLRAINGKWNGFLNFLTLPFEMFDRVARTATISAAYDQATVAFKNFEKNIKKMGRQKAADQLFDDLNLSSWQKTDVEDFLTTALKKGDLNEARYEYAKISTDRENFIYSKDAAPRMIAWARSKNPVLAQAMIFASYPMHYYNQIVKGALRAAKAGDRRQLYKLAGFSVAWVAAMKAGQAAVDEDDVPLASMFGLHPRQLAAYMVNKGPLINVTGIPELAYRPIGNLYTGVAGLSDAAMLWGYKKLGDHMDAVGKIEGNDSLDWQYLQAISQVKKSLPWQAGRDIDDAYKIMRKFAEEYDE